MFGRTFRIFLSVFLLLACVTLWAQKSDTAKKKSAPAKTATAAKKSTPTAAKPKAEPVAQPKSFDLSAMDKTANPCEDFYEYACGNWRKNNPIPSDQSRWGRFNELAEYNRQILHQILEKASVKDPKRSPIMQKIGDFYASCMDEKAVDAKGSAPLKPILNRIAAVSNRDQLVDTLAYLHALGGAAVFGFGAQPDLHNASVMIAGISQGGLGLPDRDYYINQDPKSQETRQKYVEHIAKTFELLGDNAATSKTEAQAVLAIETKLAEAAFERVKMRDPKNRDHKMNVSELAALAPGFKFERFFAATGAPQFTEVNVVPPDFFQKVNGALESVSLSDWKNYLRWQAARAASPMLSDKFVHENFDFYGKYLNGQKEIQPRWKRCVQSTDQMMGEALGQPYVAETFGPQGKQRMLVMVNALEKALSTDIKDLPWMTPTTKEQAEAKLQAVTNKIGYPEKWRDYKSLRIVRGDLLGDVQRARSFEVHRNWNKIGKPLDKTEWGMTPPTVNAYYNPAENNINFPAGILQPPFFDKRVDEAVNFGGIGVVIGHEITHGFDDQGAKFDLAGNLKNWWSDADKKEFEKRTSCIADEYSSFVSVDDLHLNGRLTLGENTADNGGVRIAYMALHNLMSQDPKNKANQVIEGFTPEQRFFLGFAQVWCENRTPESARVLVKTDPHSPGRFRVIGVVQNDPDFAKAFSCKTGDKMVSENACRVW
ncbi:MAG: M13 family metallopeptidase [Acidobacteriia bacterium]|nr:M13 family metallopeptidase [Terriglobia bacterium]